MDTMHWDLAKNATRTYILDEVCSNADGMREFLDDALAEAALPDKHHHDLPDVLASIDALNGVSDAVRNDMRAIYQILAEAEARVHGCEVDHTHFHEVGNAESIRSVLAICLAVRHLSPGRITATPVQVGSGQVECAHGTLDIPAPATAAILARGIPVCDEKLEGERCTPTSAAVILHFVDEFV